MAYASGHSCTPTTWGRSVCTSSAQKYTRVQNAFGRPIQLINGSWSSLSDSASTHRGGGAADFEGDTMTWADGVRLARCARAQGLLAYPRWWAGNHHIHTEDPSCHSLSSAAQNQFGSFSQGYDALVSNGADPLGRYMQAQIMAAYRSRLVITGVAPVGATVYPGTMSVDLGALITASHLRPQARHIDVTRFEKALWNYLGGPYRQKIKAQQGYIGDGYYGTVTGQMCSDAYAKAGMGRATYPEGIKLLQTMGFKNAKVS